MPKSGRKEHDGFDFCEMNNVIPNLDVLVEAIMNKLHVLFVLPFIVVLFGCSRSGSQRPTAPKRPWRLLPISRERLAKLPETVIDYDRESVECGGAEGCRQAHRCLAPYRRYFPAPGFAKTIPALRKELAALAEKSPNHRLGLRYFDMMMGRWDRLLDDEPFISPFGSAGAKPQGAGFYPPDMTRESFREVDHSASEGPGKFSELVHRHPAQRRRTSRQCPTPSCTGSLSRPRPKSSARRRPSRRMPR